LLKIEEKCRKIRDAWRAKVKSTIGKTVWAVPEGYIPEWSQVQEPEMTSHETLCLLNTTESDVLARVYVFYDDREPSGPYEVSVPAKRTKHVRFNDFASPEPIAKGKDFASVIEATGPIVVQHTRLDSRQNANALMSTLAFPA